MGRKEAAATAAEVAAEVVDTTGKIQKKVDHGLAGTSEVSYKTAGTGRTR